jgi:hypothetical protein
MGDHILHFDEARRLHLDVAADVRVLGDDGGPVVDDDGRPVKERKTWTLDDDFPAEALFGLFRLLNDHRAALTDALGDDGEPATVDPDAPDAFARVQARFDAEVAVYLDALLRIFQHSYPRTTADDLRRWFDHRQRKELVEAFFSLLGLSSSTPAPTPPGDTPTSNGGTPTSSPTMTTMTTASPTGTTTGQTAGQTAANRATRRAAAKER